MDFKVKLLVLYHYKVNLSLKLYLSVLRNIVMNVYSLTGPLFH